MKRTIILTIAVVSVLFAAATDRFYIENFTINPGETLTVSIQLDNEATYTAFQSDIYLPAGLTASNFALTDRKNSSHTLTATELPNGGIRLLSYSITLKAYKNNSGALVTFDVTAANNFAGDATIALRNTLFTTVSGVEIPFDDEECMVTLPTNAMRGDVNDDHNVSISDVTALIDYLLGSEVIPFNIRNADVNKDGNVSIADVTALIDYLLIGEWPIVKEQFTVNGVTFSMVHVEGGTFTMGATEEEDADYQVFVGSPKHQVNLSSYNIGQTEVTQELWVAVMGSNPSQNGSDLQCPVNCVTWDDCYTFISRLNELTGLRFRLPTEAEWEFAAKGGMNTRGYIYSGSDDIDEVAWININSDNHCHPVGNKKANELGLYDMNGNVDEWCHDWYSLYTAEPVVDPTGPETGRSRIHRGGNWNEGSALCRLTQRNGYAPGTIRNYMGLRLVLDDIQVYTVNDVSFTMIPVKGGTFTMGATEEEDADYQVFVGSPKHQVTLSSYSIGQTEVTQELWLAVMGSNPSQNGSDLQCPVNCVTWNDCDTFIARLNAMTGLRFRLPTEAEWEFAAKGGIHSRGYVYSGSDDINEVAWINTNSDSHCHPVGTKKANELGLYDMNGNIDEWCHDWYSLYTADPVINPTGPVTGMSRIHRGGNWNEGASLCRLTRRNGYAPGTIRNYMGLRLAL